MGVDRQAAAEFDAPVLDEVAGLAKRAEPEFRARARSRSSGIPSRRVVRFTVPFDLPVTT